MRIVSFDWETKDPYIYRKMGMGWVYKYHDYQNCDFKLLGCAYADGRNTEYLTDMQSIRDVIESADHIVAHNLAYDLGCLMAAGMEDLVDKYYGKSTCTMLSAILVDNTLMDHSLDKCCEIWVGENKASKEMYQEVWDLGIFPFTQDELKNGREKEIPKNKISRVKGWTIKNLDVVQEKSLETVANYAIVDADLCLKLYNELVQSGYRYYDNPAQTYTYWSKLVHVTQDYTKRGVRVDMNKLADAEEWIQSRLPESYKTIYDLAGRKFNPRSSADLVKVFLDLGLRVGKTDKGNPSVTKKILEEEQHPIADAIVETKELLKLKTDFIQKIRNIQQFTMGHNEDLTRNYGRVHPVYKVFGAKKTGRFSSNGPNFQQVPKRNKKLAQWCRGAFVPEAGETWISADYSNQEGRLQVHYGSVTECTGAAEVAGMFKKDPHYDMHQGVADLAGITRTHAKTVNHGLTYGMGQAKMCKELGLPTKTIIRYNKQVTIAGNEAAEILRKYHEIVPYIKELNNKAKTSYIKLGYIRTIGGRAIRRETALINGKRISRDYKALNKLIQGSAACQTGRAMINAYEAGLPVICTVHDELNLSGTEDQGKELQTVMEEAIKLEVPCVADIGYGSTWWEAC